MENLELLNVGQMLLVGFWGTCVIMFFSTILYIVVKGIHHVVMKNINRMRKHFIR